MDVAVNLVESYLRLNGYLTLSEIDVEARGPDGRYTSITDVDVVAVRFPGDLYAVDVHDPGAARLLLIQDPALRLEPRMIDVIIGEVKQGPASFNPGLKRHEVLHFILRRLDWIYEGGVGGVLEELRARGISETPGRSGATIRTRLVAFGAHRGDPTLHVIPLGHVVESVFGFMERFDDVLNPAQFTQPAPALLRLLVKCGFGLTFRPDDQES